MRGNVEVGTVCEGHLFGVLSGGGGFGLLALLYRVHAVLNLASHVYGRLACVFQGDLWKTADTHLSPFAMKGISYEPGFTDKA